MDSAASKARRALKSEKSDKGFYGGLYEETGDPLFKEIAGDEASHYQAIDSWLKKRSKQRPGAASSSRA